MVKTLLTLGLFFLSWQAVNYGLWLLNQPSDLAVAGGFAVFAVVVFGFHAAIKRIFPEDDEEDYDSGDDGV